MGDDLNFEDDLRIDHNALDIEWINQPNLLMKYSEELAYAEKKVSKLHEELKVVRSELIKEANDDPEVVLGAGKKAKDSLVEAYYRAHPRHRRIKTEMIDAEFEKAILYSAVVSLQHRKIALENLVRMHGQQYFAGPQAPRDLNKDHFDDLKSKMFKTKMKNRRDKNNG